ncbi:MAG: transposase [Candidatus Margulisiibacteriota bacterium]
MDITLRKKAGAVTIPLLGFLNRNGLIINLWNRPGNTSSGNNSIGFFDECYSRVQPLLDLKGVIADSGFYSESFVEHLSSKGLPCIIAAKLYSTLQRAVFAQDNWEEIDRGLSVCDFTFRHDGWEKPYRYVAVRQTISKRKKAIGKQLSLFEIETADYRYSVWLTTKAGTPYEVWKLVRPRSNDENVIKAFKEDFALGGFSMKSFYATEAAMVIRALIYNIFVLFRQEIMSKKERHKRLKTLRYQYFIIPAHLGISGHQHVLRLSAHTKKLKSKINYLLHQVRQYVPPDYVIRNALE